MVIGARGADGIVTAFEVLRGSFVEADVVFSVKSERVSGNFVTSGYKGFPKGMTEKDVHTWLEKEGWMKSFSKFFDDLDPSAPELESERLWYFVKRAAEGRERSLKVYGMSDATIYRYDFDEGKWEKVAICSIAEYWEHEFRKLGILTSAGVVSALERDKLVESDLDVSWQDLGWLLWVEREKWVDQVVKYAIEKKGGDGAEKFAQKFYMLAMGGTFRYLSTGALKRGLEGGGWNGEFLRALMITDLLGSPEFREEVLNEAWSLFCENKKIVIEKDAGFQRRFREIERWVIEAIGNDDMGGGSLGVMRRYLDWGIERENVKVIDRVFEILAERPRVSQLPFVGEYLASDYIAKGGVIKVKRALDILKKVDAREVVWVVSALLEHPDADVKKMTKEFLVERVGEDLGGKRSAWKKWVKKDF